jgi:6,7-dimethyl-8-ribityllumazine synthase
MPGVLKSTAGLKKNQKLSKKRIAIVVSEWNDAITEALYQGAFKGLTDLGINKTNIVRVNVPGTFELTLGALRAAEQKKIDAVICLGCVIKGETPHFEYICHAAAYGITEVNIKTGKPVIFGVLTTLNKRQALERAGGKYGNKGEEAAITAVKMLS